jgi:hypothetical protein
MAHPKGRGMIPRNRWPEFVIGLDQIGAHRLAAARKFGWDTIPAYIVRMPEIDRQLWEISENLHRSELTPEEAALQRAEYARLSAVERGGDRAGCRIDPTWVNFPR